MGEGVGGPVGGQEEGLDVGLRGVVGGRGPELEEVEGREGGEEEGEAPERGGGGEEDEEGGYDARGEGGAEAEGADGYAGEGLGLVRGVGGRRERGVGGGGRGAPAGDMEVSWIYDDEGRGRERWYLLRSCRRECRKRASMSSLLRLAIFGCFTRGKGTEFDVREGRSWP